MVKPNVAHQHNGILFGLGKWNPDVDNNQREPRSHSARWNKSGTKEEIMWDSIYNMKYLE